MSGVPGRHLRLLAGGAGQEDPAEATGPSCPYHLLFGQVVQLLADGRCPACLGAAGLDEGGPSSTSGGGWLLIVLPAEPGEPPEGRGRLAAVPPHGPPKA